MYVALWHYASDEGIAEVAGPFADEVAALSFAVEHWGDRLWSTRVLRSPEDYDEELIVR